MSTVGQRVKEKRLELGMTQDALARAAGYHSRSTINKIESGERNLSFPRIAELADALGVTRATLWSKVNGVTPINIKQAKTLADMMGMTLEDFYALVPKAE